MKPIFQITIATALAVIVAGAIGGSPFIAYYILVGRTGQKFEQIQRGDSTTVVVSLMGNPDSIRRCGEDLWWGQANYLGKNDGRCVAEARYGFFLNSWVVGYSVNGRVVSKIHVASE